MNISILSVSNLQKIFTAIAVFAMVFSPYTNVQFASAHHSPYGSTPITTVDICHNNNGNGFVLNTVSVSSSGAPQGGHDANNGAHSPDIIPPYHYTDGNGNVQSYAGKNWTGNLNNQAIWQNDCATPTAAISITALPTLQCGVQNVNIAGFVTFQLNTSADHLVIKLDGNVVVGDTAIDDAGPDGFSQPWAYVLNNVSVGNHTLEAFIYDNGPTPYSGVKASDTENFTITACPPAPVLTLVKNVDNTAGGSADADDWTLSADSASTDISGVSGSAAVTNKTVTPDTYTLSESTGPARYTASEWSCVKNTEAPVLGSSITLANGDTATCTITNTYVPPAKASITVVKEIINDNGGTAAVETFKYWVNGATEVFHNVASLFDAGSFTLTETNTMGYTQSVWGGSCAEDGTVTLGEGESGTCTITNDDIAPTITVTKVVNNGTSKTPKTAGQFDIKLTATDVNGGDADELTFAGSNAGTQLSFDAGEYSVTEPSHDGYSVTYSDGCSGTATVGGSYSCTVTNTFIEPTVATVNFEKVIPTTPDYSYPDADVDDFDFSVVGGNVNTSTQHGGTLQLPIGTYTIGETGPAGYSVAYSGICAGGVITIAQSDLGESYTCTITNTELPACSDNIDNDFDGQTDAANDAGCDDGTDDNETDPGSSITIDKVVTGEQANEETAFTFDYAWTVDPIGDVALSGNGAPVVISNLNPGKSTSYTISEINIPSRWELESISCVDTSDNSEELVSIDDNEVTINLSAGENVACTFTNKYTPKDSGGNDERIIVKKEVTAGSDTDESFQFDASWLDEVGDADFMLAAGTEFDSGDLNIADNDVFGLSEINLPLGWSLSDVSCVSSNINRTDIDESQFVLNDGETITCTFTNDQERYVLEGYVWNDTNENGIYDTETESPLPGWTVRATADGETPKVTESDVDGYYSFNVPRGTWTISEELQTGWDQTFPSVEDDRVHVVVVPEENEEMTLLNSIFNFFIPTANAAVIAPNLGNFNFGNIPQAPGYSQGSYGGGNGTRVSLRDGGGNNDDDEPEGQVLGEATSTMPVGAPNTGKGSTSASFEIHALAAILASRRSVRATNGK